MEIIEVITDFVLVDSTSLIPFCCGTMVPRPTGFVERHQRCRRQQGKGTLPYGMIKRFPAVTSGNSSFDRGGVHNELNKKSQ